MARVRISCIGVWLTATVACSNSPFAHHLADGGADAPFVHDGAVDARMHDAPTDAPSPGAVTIAVTGTDGLPASGATVYFQNADSSLVAEMQTGSDGEATQVMAPGGFVTLIEPQAVAVTVPAPAATITPSNQGLDTFAGVQPGDLLVVVLGSPTAQSVSFSLTVPTDGSANSSELFSSCGQAPLLQPGVVRAHPALASVFNISLTGCNGVADMLVVTFDVNGNPLNELYAPNVAVGNDTNVTLTQPYAPMTNQVVFGTNISPSVSTSAEHLLFGPNGALQLQNSLTPTVVTNANASVCSYPQPTDPLISLEEQEYSGDGVNVLDDQRIGDWGQASSSTVLVDSDVERLPDFTAQPTFDVTTQQVQWQQTGGGSASIDGIFASTSFSRTIQSGSGSSATTVTASWTWNIIAPGTEVGALVHPTLPTDLFAWNGAAGDTINVGFLELGSVTGGYDAVRAVALSFDFDTIAASTPSGHVVIDNFQPPPALARGLAHRRGRSMLPRWGSSRVRR